MAESNALPLSANTGDFFKILDYEFYRAVRYNNVVTLMFIKLCHLDEIAGNYGQLTAARLLRGIERLIRDNIRQSDREFIYGKDELMLILPNTPKDGAHCMVPKLQRLIEGYLLTNEREVAVTVRPKFGIASYPHDARPWNGRVGLAGNVA